MDIITHTPRRKPSDALHRLADDLTDTEKAKLVNELVARFGSRRALIEEIDRRKRLSLLKPDNRINQKADGQKYSRMKNEPNPEWRAISTPSLLIPGELLSDFKPKAPDLTLSILETQEHMKRRKPDRPGAKKRGRKPGTLQPGNCAGCGIDRDMSTPGCNSCEKRHQRRAKALREAGVIK